MDEQNQNTTPAPGNKSPLLIIGIVVLLIIGGVSFYLIQNSQQTQQPTATPMQQPTSMPEATGETEPTEAMSQAQEVTIEASNFKFSLPEIRVKKGETVRVTLVNTQGFHDIVFEQFNARTQQINAGQSETIEFVADTAGTFEYYCSVGQHRQMGMVGNLIVEE